MKALSYCLAALVVLAAMILWWGNEVTKDTFAGRSGLSISECTHAARQFGASSQEAERTCWSTAIPTGPTSQPGSVVSLGSPGWTEPGTQPRILFNAGDRASEDKEIARYQFVCPEKLASDKLREENDRRFVIWAMHNNAGMTLAELAELRKKLLSDQKCRI